MSVNRQSENGWLQTLKDCRCVLSLLVSAFIRKLLNTFSVAGDMLRDGKPIKAQEKGGMYGGCERGGKGRSGGAG